MPSQRSARERHTALLEASVAAARGAAGFIREQARNLSGLDWRRKQVADFVTDVDTGAEARIREVVMRAFPDATIVGEELSPGDPLDADLTFIVDPLDGTTNFLHGFPAYAVSIAASWRGAVQTGVILDITRDELFTSSLGGGAFLDGTPIQVSRTADPSRALIGTGFPFKHLEMLGAYQGQFARITAASAGIRRAGSAALDLAMVACGRLDAFWELRLAPWDIAAGLLLVREAGGRVTDTAGRDIAPGHTPVVASNPQLLDWLLRTLESEENAAP